MQGGELSKLVSLSRFTENVKIRYGANFGMWLGICRLVCVTFLGICKRIHMLLY